MNRKALIRDKQTLVPVMTPLAILANTACLLGAVSAPHEPHGSQTHQEQSRKGAEKETTEVRPAHVPVVRTVKAGGGRLDWCTKSDLIAFDVRGKDREPQPRG